MSASDDENNEAGRMQFLLELRRRGITDRLVLRAMDKVPREQFVEPGFADFAYANRSIPIDCGQTISPPYVVAYMTQQLHLHAQHRVLEVGTGSGYHAAVLSRLVNEVVSIERYRTLADKAKLRLAELGYGNIEIVIGDGLAGALAKAPYDRIIVTAAVETVPQALLVDQLADDGIMLLPLGSQDQEQRLVKLTKSQSGILREDLIPVRFVSLLSGTALEL